MLRFLIPTIVFSFIVGFSTAILDCPSSKPCMPSKEVPIQSLITSKDIPAINALNLKTDEQLVSRQGHVEGVKPISYDLTLNFKNKTHYDGSIEIKVIVVEATNRIVLNRRFNTPEIDYDQVRVYAICENGSNWIQICLERIVLLNDSFLLKTSEQLKPNATYLITAHSFRSQADGDSDTNIGSIGLASSGSDESGYWGLTTIFQMRYARTVFPCFDHPSLKARFSVCLEHPASWIAASNRPLNRSESINREGDKRQWKRSCFKPTPPIPTYVLTFALMENYSYNSMVLPSGPLLELYSPTSKTAELLWILNNTKSALNAMRRLTSIDCGLEKLSLYVVYPAPYWGIENYGLITLEGAFLEMGPTEARATSILNHEVIHQWLGDVVTVSNWREICIQEGLTAFVEWLLSEELQNVSIKEQEAEAASSFRYGYNPLITQYNLTKEIADYCFSVPPLLFNNIYDYYGRDTFKTFLNHLISQKYYSSADVDFFDRSLVDATGDRNLTGYVREWFGQPGLLYLFVSRGAQNAREIHIRQGYVQDSDRVLSDDSTIRPVPTKILGSDGRLEKVMIPKIRNFTISMNNASSTPILIDPDNELPARKVYELATYKEWATGKFNLSAWREKSVLFDFCESLTLDVFPWGEDARQFDSSAWSGLFSKAMLLTNENEHGACRCCMGTYEENKDNERCYWTWAKDCQKLRIIGLMGRNYTLPEGSPFG